MRIHRFLFIAFLVCFSKNSICQGLEFTAPKAHITPFYKIIHGDTLMDDYHWLREKDTPDVVNYLYAENAYAENIMKNTRILQKKLYEEMRGNYKESYSDLPRKEDNYFYYTRYEKGKEYGFYCRKKDSLTAPEEVYFDANEAAKGFMFFQMGVFSISPNHQLLIYGVDTKGDRLNYIFIRDLNNGQLLKDSLPKTNSIAWAKDNKTIFYTTIEKNTKRADKIYKHTLGESCSQDILIFEEPNKTFQVNLKASESKEYIFINSSKTKSNEIWFLNANTPHEKFNLIQKRGPDINYGIDHYNGKEFFISTNWNAINHRVMKTLIKTPSKDKWIEVVPHNANRLINNFRLYKDFMILNEKENAINHIRIINLTTGIDSVLQFSENIYNTHLFSDFNYSDNKIRFSYSSLVTPSEVYDFDLLTNTRELIKKDTLLREYNKDNYQAERVYANAPDGKKVPISLVYKKGLKTDASNPILLTAYGSYGAPTDIHFSASALSYLDRGFVYALAHIRGSDDLGKQWYEDGKMLNKKNTFTDFIACAEYLIEQKYTSKEKIAIEGASAGGLLMGAVTNMRPDLFKCVVANVPFVDVINTMLDSTLPLTTFEYDEWGNPHLPVYYNYMKSYSPYDNVVEKDYPNILITGGYNDSQVPYWEPAKWTAKLRASKTDTNTLLLKTSMNGGHGLSTGRYNYYKDLAFSMAFVMNSLGIKENYLAVTGKVFDANNNPLPYVSVYVNGTTNGTTSNYNGDFYIELKQGQNSELVFQSIGFKKSSVNIDIKSQVTDLKIVMQSENIELRQVEISAKAKDPAIGIIKNAISKRKEHFEQANNYSASIYIKGQARLDSVPKNLPFFIPKDQMPDSNDIGLMYLSESVAKFHFQLPDNYKEEMFSSKVAGTSRGFSANRVEDILFNFYKNSQKISFNTEKEFISPISDASLIFYKFKLEGTFFEDDKMIYKIMVTPRNIADPLYHGYIYIMDELWNIHSLDLFVTKDAGIDFVDTLHIRQNYKPVSDTVWMPLSLQITNRYKFMGFDAGDNFIGFFSNYQMNKTFPKKFFHNETFRIEDNANKKDTIYWKETRPILLTNEENKHYVLKDSLFIKETSKEYLDSIDSKYNKLTFGKAFITGISYQKQEKQRYININPIANSISYNTVEGAAINLAGYLSRRTDSTIFRINPAIRYGFESKTWYGSMRCYKYFNLKNFEYIDINTGKFTSQFNTNEPIHPFINTFYSLIGEQNYQKIYEKTYFKIQYSREIINGLKLKTGFEYNNRNALVNRKSFTFYDYTNQAFSSNDPEYPFSNVPSFENHNSLIFNIDIQIRFKQKYESSQFYKRIIGSKYPTIYLNYTKGVEALYSNVNFDRIQVGIGKTLKLGYFGTSEFDFIGGTFLNDRKMYFMDYKHFNGNQTHLLKNNSEWNFYDGGRSQITNFNNLNYYLFSTNTSYLELHYEHRFQGLILGKFPLIKKLRIGEVAGFNAIYTGKNRDYQEIFLGLDNIARFIRLDFVASYRTRAKLEPQIRIGINGGF